MEIAAKSLSSLSNEVIIDLSGKNTEEISKIANKSLEFKEALSTVPLRKYLTSRKELAYLATKVLEPAPTQKFLLSNLSYVKALEALAKVGTTDQRYTGLAFVEYGIDNYLSGQKTAPFKANKALQTARNQLALNVYLSLSIDGKLNRAKTHLKKEANPYICLQTERNSALSSIAQAAQKGNLDFIKLCIETVPPKAGDLDAALWQAIRTGQNSVMIDCLLKKGANPYREHVFDGNKDNATTAYQEAKSANNLKAISLIYKYKPGPIVVPVLKKDGPGCNSVGGDGVHIRHTKRSHKNGKESPAKRVKLTEKE